MSLSHRIRDHIRSNIYGIVAIFIALGGTAYAVDGPNPGQNTIGSEDIIGNEVKSDDIGNGRIFNLDIADDTIQSGKIKDSTLTALDLNFDAVGTGEIQTDAVNAAEVAASAIDSDEISNNTLTDDDLGAASVATSEVANNTLTDDDLASSSVASAEVASGAIGSSEVANDTLTQADIAGGYSNGAVGFGAGAVPNGRCEHFNISVPGTSPGEAVVVSLAATPPEGMLFYGVGVPAADQVTMALCNFTGGSSPVIDDIPVRVMTFG